MEEKKNRPCDYENVNYRLLNNKDGKFAWRPFQLIHPAIYVSLVHEISKEDNWNTIVSKIEEFRRNSKIRCLSLPVESDDELSDNATSVSNWWHSVEQGSIELALKYQYVVHTDISDCYGSIYTHSIAWALHTREVAKNRRNDKNLIGNVIDSRIQDMSFGLQPRFSGCIVRFFSVMTSFPFTLLNSFPFKASPSDRFKNPRFLLDDHPQFNDFTRETGDFGVVKV